MHTEDDTKLTPREVRALAGNNKLTAATSALCPDYVKASLLIFSALPPGIRRPAPCSR